MSSDAEARRDPPLAPAPRDDPAPARAPCLALLAVLALTAALYARTARHGFVGFDDPVYVRDNPMVARGLSLDGLRWAFGFHEGNWHPLTWLSHMLDVQLFGPEPGPQHLVNAALHVLNTALLAWLVVRLTGARWSAVLVAALFGLHPLRVESVAWASERKDVLAGTFFLLTLLAYERYARRGGAARYLVVAGTLLLGLMAKSMLVTLPLVMGILDFWPLGRLSREAVASGGPSRKRLVVEKLPLLALCLVVGSATLWIQQREGAVGTLGSLGLPARACNAGLTYWIYLAQTLWPARLACFVPHPVIVTPHDQLVNVLFRPGLAALLGLVVASAFAWRQRRARPHLLAGWLWYLIVAAPVVGFVQVGQQAHADRYTYLPLIGPILALVFGLRALALRRLGLRPALATASALAVLALAPLTWRQIGTWRDSRTLFTHALAVTEKNYMAATFLGMVERRTGELESARDHFAFALECNKQHVPAMLELGLTLEALHDLPGARRQLNRALRNAPESSEVKEALRRVERAIGSPAPKE